MVLIKKGKTIVSALILSAIAFSTNGYSKEIDPITGQTQQDNYYSDSESGFLDGVCDEEDSETVDTSWCEYFIDLVSPLASHSNANWMASPSR